MASSLFFDIAIIFIVVAVISLLARSLKQPLIPFYILTGVLLVPVFGFIADRDIVTSMSQFGIIFLLFIVGLEMDFNRIKQVSAVSILGGSIIVVLLYGAGMVVANLLGFGLLEAVYFGLVFAFSSTMVTIKLLDDKNELDSLHGKIAIGLLILQDIVAVVAFIVLTWYATPTASVTMLGAEIAGLALLFFLCTKFLFPKLFAFAARSQELLFILSIGVCLLFAYLTGLISPHAFGIGAFVAGLSLGNLPYNLEIGSRINPLKDFFAVLFFISLGMMLPLASIAQYWFPALVMLVLIFILRPLITYFVVRFFKFMPRVSFLTALTQIEISEFGLILVFFGLAASHVGEELFGVVILTAVVSIALTAYPFAYKNQLFHFFHDALFRRTEKVDLAYLPEKKKKFVLLVGYDRLGYSILETLNKLKLIVIVVDYNPDIIQQLIDEKIPCVYGDVADASLLDHLAVEKARLVVSTIPDVEATSLLMKHVREKNKKVPIFVTAESIRDALLFYEEGADYVIIPRYVGGKHVSSLIQQAKGKVTELRKQKRKHLDEIQKRLEKPRKHS